MSSHFSLTEATIRSWSIILEPQTVSAVSFLSDEKAPIIAPEFLTRPMKTRQK